MDPRKTGKKILDPHSSTTNIKEGRDERSNCIIWI